MKIRIRNNLKNRIRKNHFGIRMHNTATNIFIFYRYVVDSVSVKMEKLFFF
jgi:hypothetical protein